MKRIIAVVIAISLIAGCASGAYKEGKAFLATGEYEKGLASLEAAVREAPENAQYRQALATEREAVLLLLLNEAEAHRGKGDWEKAEAIYRRILGIDPNHARAAAGRRAIELERELKVSLESARALYDAQKLDEAKEKLQIVLRLQPRHRDARRLLREIDEQTKHRVSPERTLAQKLSKPISLDLREAALRSALDVIFRSAGLTYVLDKDVRADQRVTLWTKNTPAEEALRILLMSNQLAKKIVSTDSVLIYPDTPAKLREYQELVSKTFYVTNADVKQTANMIKTLVKTKDIFVDEKLGMLIMKDTPEAVRYAEQLVNAQDIAESEVVLQVEVLEVATNNLLELGVRWPSQLGVSVVGEDGTPGTISLSEWHGRSSELVQLSISNPALLFNLRNTEGRSNLLANPRIRVKNHEKAKIHIGEKVPVITNTSTATGFVSESVTYLDVGLKLDVEPTIYLEDEVGIKVSLEVSNIIREIPRETGTLVYQVGTRNAATMLRLNDGETQILAGLINTEERMSANRVPGLGDLPLLSRLFGSQQDTNNRTEIVLLITPHIVRSLEHSAEATAQLSVGTEAVVGIRSNDFKVAEISNQTTEAKSKEAAQNTPAKSNALAADAGVAVSPVASSQVAEDTESATPASSAARFLWKGPEQAKVGEVVSLTLHLADAPPIASAPLQLTFDPQVLQVLDVKEGTFFKQGGSSTSFTYRVDPAGAVLIGVSRSGKGAEGEGDLVLVNFRPIKPAEKTAVEIGSAAPRGIGGKAVTITVTPAHVLQIGQ